MGEIEQTKATAGENADLGVQTFDEGAGEATYEKVGDPRPVGFQGLQESFEAGDMLLAD